MTPTDPTSPRTAQGRIPIAMTIAGSDSGGGAGIQADLKAFSAMGVYGASVITALTAQNTCSVDAIHEVPADFVRQQLLTVLSDLSVDAIKIGMLASVPIIRSISEVISEFPDIPVVLDPVMVAKSGDALLQTDAIDALGRYLFPLASVITPNLPEAALLLGSQEAQDLRQMQQQARQLMEFGCHAVLIKGGHLHSQDSTDLLLHDDRMDHFSHPRILTGNTHGTGCTLSSAIAAGLARSESLFTAVEQAEAYLHQAIVQADRLQIGHGHGPVHHFHALWDSE